MRYSNLDLARSVLMLLGVFYHSSLIFSGIDWWRVSSGSSSVFLFYFGYISSMFRMESFFIISGFFAVMVYQKDSYGFLSKRLPKLLIPFFFVGLTLNIATALVSDNFKLHSGLDFFIFGDWIGHLWFLSSLSLYTVIYFLLQRVGFITFISNYEFRFITLLIFLLIPLLAFLGRSLSYLTYEASFMFFNFKYIYYYFPYFMLGAFFYNKRELFFDLLSFRYLYLYGFFVISLLLVDFQLEDKVLKALVSSYASLFLSFTVLCLIFIFFDKFRPSVGIVLSSSYTVYLLHEPLIVFFYVFFFSKLNSIVNDFVIFISLSLSVIFVSLLLHTFVIKNSRVLFFLFNGSMKR